MQKSQMNRDAAQYRAPTLGDIFRSARRQHKEKRQKNKMKKPLDIEKINQ